jgi:hypothetical protein
MDSGMHSFNNIEKMFGEYEKKIIKVRLLCFNKNALSYLETLHKYVESVEVRVYEYGSNSNVTPMHFSLFDNDCLSYGTVEKENDAPAKKEDPNSVVVFGEENEYIIKPFRFWFEKIWEAAKDNVIIKI